MRIEGSVGTIMAVGIAGETLRRTDLGNLDVVRLNAPFDAAVEHTAKSAFKILSQPEPFSAQQRA